MREVKIVVNGVVLSEGQSMAVRVAVTSMRIALHADDGEGMRDLGEIGPLYDAQLAEVEVLLTSEP